MACAFTILLLAVQTACVAGPPNLTARQALVVQTEAAARAQLGDPGRVTDDGTTRELTYSYDWSIPYGYYNSFTNSYMTLSYQHHMCTIEVKVHDGIVEAVAAEGSSCN